ncbi:flt3-interacting zinc finger protein 1 isoform X2 [Alligator mississippiensis]|nr:flt3-interacting zinc finger protein 1 isoform X2 [Alligator mississippiensis]
MECYGKDVAEGPGEAPTALCSAPEDACPPAPLTDNGTGARVPFHCSECDKSFRYRSDLRRHFARHTELKPFQCPHCSKSFKHSFNLVNHIRSHTGERPYRCTLCPKGFRDSTGLLHHQVVHTGEKPYCCHVCELRFSSRSSLGRHLKRQHRTPSGGATPVPPAPTHCLERLCGDGRGRTAPYGCGACGRHFCLAAELCKHWLAHTDIKPFKCPECERDFNAPSLLERHKLTHAKDRPLLLPCQACAGQAEPLGQSACLACKPQETRPLDSLYQCECGTFFANAGALATHLAAHTGEASFTCGICGMNFGAVPPLEAHQLSHAVLRPSTPGSPVQAPASGVGGGGELERHLLPRLELRAFPPRPGKKLYKCTECEKFFRSPRDLDRHVLVHTGEKPYQCAECGKFFRHECYLKRHRLLHSGERPFQCSVCHKGFITFSNLSRHLKLHRGID